ncbi:MAG: cache domain-containing protein, partial [Mobilitalea sp.]
MKKIHTYYSKLFLWILITVIISSGLVSGISILSNVNRIQSITEQSLLSSAEQKVKIYEVNIRSLHALSKSIGDDVEIKNYFINLRNGVEDEEFYQTLKINLEEEVNSYSGLLDNTFFVYDDICYIDGVGGTSVGYSFSSEWYKKVMKDKIHYLGELKKSPVTGLSVIVSGYPVLDENNQVLAVFGLAINLNGFSNSIIFNSDNSKENTMIIDESGTIIAANDTELIYNYDIDTELQKLSHYIEDGNEGITYYKKDNVNYIAAVKKSELGVTIIQSLPVSVYRNPIIYSIMVSIFVLLMILG